MDSGLGGCAIAVRADVAVEADVLRLFETAVQEFGPLGGLVNNAGITGGVTRVDALTVEAIDRVYAVNVRGSILCAREAVRRKLTRHGGQGVALPASVDGRRLG